MTSVAAVLLLAGALLSVLAAVGLHRFDDVYARMHAATKPATLGLLLLLAGAALRMHDPADIAKLALAGILQFVTAPIAAHVIGRAAYATGSALGPDTSIDELSTAHGTAVAPTEHD